MNLELLFDDLNKYVVNSEKNFDCLNEFLVYYNTIIETDKVQPIFSQTNKYFSQFNQYNKKKYNSLNYKKAQKWKSNNNLTDKELIQKTIIQYFNKLSSINFDNVLNDFINDILKIENNILFDIISIEIINKCINDPQYQSQYIQICSVIWENTNILKNFINIYDENNKKYYQFKLNDKNKYGPFKTVIDLKNDVILKYNFKKVLLKYLKIEFDKKNNYINEYESCENIEKKFKIKRKIFGIIEIIILLYNKKYIEDNIINNILQSLFKEPNEINFEIIFNIFKNTEFNNINYKKNILIFKNNKKFNNRPLYFIDEIAELINDSQKTNKINKYTNNKNENKNKQKNNKQQKKKYNIDNDEEEFVVSINKKDKEYILNVFKNTNELDDFIYTLFYSYFENENNLDFIKLIIKLSFTKKVINKNIINKVFVNFNENIDDLTIDFKNIKEKINNLYQEINDL